jgi:hypothetical protein
MCKQTDLGWESPCNGVASKVQIDWSMEHRGCYMKEKWPTGLTSLSGIEDAVNWKTIHVDTLKKGQSFEMLLVSSLSRTPVIAMSISIITARTMLALKENVSNGTIH